jgi:hypothetical protein
LLPWDCPNALFASRLKFPHLAVAEISISDDIKLLKIILQDMNLSRMGF